MSEERSDELRHHRRLCISWLSEGELEERFNTLHQSFQESANEYGKITEQLLNNLTESIASLKSVGAMPDFNDMMKNFLSMKMSGLGELAQKRLMNNMKSMMDDIAEELKQVKFVVQTTIERELRQHAGIGSAEKAAEQDISESEEHVIKLRHFLQYEKVEKLKEAFDAKIVAGCMYQLVALTLTETEQIQESQTMSDAAEKLLNILLTAPRAVFQCFMDALRRTNQEHVYSRIQSPDIAVKSEHCEVIRKHYVFLVDKINAKNSLLIDLLYDDKVLTLTENEDLTAQRTHTRQNEKLLSVLSRKSPEQWGKFLIALDKSRQSHIRECITKPTELELEKLKVNELVTKLAETERLNREMQAKLEATADATGKDVTEGHQGHTICQQTTTEHIDKEN